MINFKRVLILIAVLLIAGLSVGDFHSTGVAKDNIYESIKIFSDALNIVQHNYVDEDQLKAKELIYGAIKGMLSTLDDPHTRFMTPQVHKEMKVETEGSFGGLGIVIGIKDDRLTVISPIEGTPAYEAGIKAGDWILEIEGEPTKDIDLNKAVQKLRGPKGTKVNITVKRRGVDEPFSFTITRDIIEIKSVKSDIIQDKIGYIRITTFNQHTEGELSKALKEVIDEKKVENLILDLRNNPGGLLNIAVAVADKFLDSGIIVSTRGRDVRQNQEYPARVGNSYLTQPMVVLINQGSASASEIVTGAIKDNKRGVVLGKKSFGKGSVQTVLPLSDGSAMAITTAKYYTPAGSTIHGKGIEPDIDVDSFKWEEEEEESMQKLREGKFIENFTLEHNPYTEKQFSQFMKELSANGVTLEEKWIRKLTDKELRRLNGEKDPIYDLDTDLQLKNAVDLLVASHIFEGRSIIQSKETKSE